MFRLPPMKSVSSYYSFVIWNSGELTLVWGANVTYWRVHLSSNDVIREANFDFNGASGLLDDKNRTVWSIASKDFEDRSWLQGILGLILMDLFVIACIRIQSLGDLALVDLAFEWFRMQEIG
ncbi:hypothetical protein V6N12_064369 [Hibiscus sabdariffa]|uniref:Bulb-type lectin domain-containing protein n=1 Tax=Hibiscus sabdariffa TaxID=183260 RepID=A0ABR2G5M5_9ROSI